MSLPHPTGSFIKEGQHEKTAYRCGLRAFLACSLAGRSNASRAGIASCVPGARGGQASGAYPDGGLPAERGFFLRTYTRRLRAGADLRHSAGAPRGEIPLCADAPRAACCRRESRSGGEYHGSCAGVGQLPESFGAGDVPHRASGGVFKHAGEPRQHGPETH